MRVMEDAMMYRKARVNRLNRAWPPMRVLQRHAQHTGNAGISEQTKSDCAGHNPDAGFMMSTLHDCMNV
jgi:hypothetical protein